MKKLLWLAILLPFFATAQTPGTIQLTKTTRTVRANFGTDGLDSLLALNGAPVDGYVPLYKATLKKSIWVNPSTFTPTLSTTTISLGGTANGMSVSGGVFRLHRVTETTGGAWTNGTDTVGGYKRFANGAAFGAQISTNGIADVIGISTTGPTITVNTTDGTGGRVEVTTQTVASDAWFTANRRSRGSGGAYIQYRNQSVTKWQEGMFAGDSKFYIKNWTTGSATNPLVIDTLNAVTLSNTITATGFIKPSGTSSQFLKADGSSDGTTYVIGVSGTTNRITSTGGASPVIDISASYVGQTSITTLGTIGTGAWQGTVIGSNYGGAGTINGILKANGSGVVSLAGSSDFSSAGIVLTTTNQSVGGWKNFTDSITSVRSGTNKFKVQSIGASQVTSVDIHRGDRAGIAVLRYYTKNDASYKWQAGLVGDSKYIIQNATTGSVSIPLEIDTTNVITFAKGFIVSTGTSTFGGDITASGRVLLTSSTSATAQGQDGYNTTVGRYVWPKAGSSFDITEYNSAGATVRTVATGTVATTLYGALTGTSATLTASSANQLVLNSTNASGGYIDFQRSGVNKAYIGNAGSVTGSNTDDLAIQSQAAIRFQTGGNNTRYTIDASGNNTWTGSGEYLGIIKVKGTNPGSLGASVSAIDHFNGGFRLFSNGIDNSNNGVFRLFTTRANDSNTIEVLNISGGGTLTTTLATGSLTSVAGVITSSSDSKMKDVHGVYKGSALTAIGKLNPGKYWNFNSKSGYGKNAESVKQFGLLADEVHATLGEEFAATQGVYNDKGKFVPTLIDGEKSYSLSDRALLSLTIQATQEQNVISNADRKRIEALEAEVLKLKSK